MRVLAIDPGPMRSAYVVLTDGIAHERIEAHGFDANHVIAREVITGYCSTGPWDAMAIEMIASYGMAVGAEVFDTCVWIGRFIERWMLGRSEYRQVYRAEVKMHLCGNVRAKDPNIRQALIDRFGGKDRAIGKKAMPGPLYGLKGDEWSALAVGLTFTDQSADRKRLIEKYAIKPQPKPIQNDADIPF